MTQLPGDGRRRRVIQIMLTSIAKEMAMGKGNNSQRKETKKPKKSKAAKGKK